MSMLSARIHVYQKPLVVEKVPKPRAKGPGVVVKVGAAGLCHSDLHLIAGEWKDSIPLRLPLAPGHEIAGYVEELGEDVPGGLFKVGDLVAVFGGWGCGVCHVCKLGDEQSCPKAKWPGISQDGGYAQYVSVPSYRFLIKADGRLSAEELAPLTDAGLTPYRAIRRFRHMLVPGTSVAVVGIGGLGSYGVQYARFFGPASTVMAIDRNEKKLDLAKKFGADRTFPISDELRAQVMDATGGRGVDLVLDCAGAENTISASAGILAKGGVLAIVGLFGSMIKVPLMPAVINENTITGSLWGNYNELAEVIELARQGKVKHSLAPFKLEDINGAIDQLKAGKIAGRAVITPN
ncbi:MAG: NAD(P)-dependent alcohol dehydrogenase [Nitrososphaera sp.]|uniref:NAD(P)-dependent alcohol dehydrogenase n=1 Tax=Nitrososphaera sp. TaxID=1971748 RepID=UPI001825EF20|nr:NAD(P)-dependent alcohol dehydrogenase [Nitrososphaera sp.]NWG36836.1 NAD(P)-dependent alcohol dehydrogenase [Nitrososphaera sp.]